MRPLTLAICCVLTLTSAFADDAPTWQHEAVDDWRLARVDGEQMILRFDKRIRIVGMANGETVKEYELEQKPLGFTKTAVVGSDGYTTIGMFDLATGEHISEVQNARSAKVYGSSLYVFLGDKLRRFEIPAKKAGKAITKFPIGRLSDPNSCGFVGGRVVWTRGEGTQLACYDMTLGRMAWKKKVGAVKWIKKVLVKTSKRTFHRKVPVLKHDSVEKYINYPRGMAVAVVCSRLMYNPWLPPRNAALRTSSKYLWLIDVAKGKDTRIPLKSLPGDHEDGVKLSWIDGPDGALVALTRKHSSDPTIRWEVYSVKGKLIVSTGFVDADRFHSGAKGTKQVLMSAGAEDSRTTYAVKSGKHKSVTKKLWSTDVNIVDTYGKRYLGWRKKGDEALELLTLDDKGAAGTPLAIPKGDLQIRRLGGRAIAFYRDRARIYVLDAAGATIKIIKNVKLSAVIDREPRMVGSNLLIHTQGKGWSLIGMSAVEKTK